MLTLHEITTNLKHFKDALNIRKEKIMVKLDLGRMEVRDEYVDLEKKMHAFTEKSKVIGEDTVEVAKKSYDAAKHFSEETGEFAKKTLDATKHFGEETTEVAKITMDTAKHIGEDIKKGYNDIRHH